MRFVLVHSHLALVRSPIASLLTHPQKTTWLSKANSSLSLQPVRLTVSYSLPQSLIATVDSLSVFYWDR